ncbi:MAG: nucleotidyl transferase AbiEii/AbiGii toxin family protein [Chitinispirillales bacterium]|jgi:predicted nucleotidyltransferase component of viral defense system|nr:nucleotidyl transferase AbiEii/AbiGii toxin family protein [Chitinispirillales bacterium]
MILPSEHYEVNLYPVQDGVLDIISRSGTDFFLTGGTALSRGYYNHRYSDDLDFFLNRGQTFEEQTDRVLALLREGGFVWDEPDDFFRAEHFTTLRIRYGDSQTLLKLDFVNDLVPHFGDIRKTELFYRTDSVRNILSNKLSAIYRCSPKDVADIWAIAMRESIDWIRTIREAKEKDAGLETPDICNILKSMPQEKFDTIPWIKKPDWSVFCDDIGKIALDMLVGV